MHSWEFSIWKPFANLLANWEFFRIKCLPRPHGPQEPQESGLSQMFSIPTLGVGTATCTIPRSSSYQGNPSGLFSGILYITRYL